MRYITKPILIFLMTQTCTFASNNSFQPFGSTANSIATFTKTGGGATSLIKVAAATYTTSDCSGATAASTYSWSSGSWPVNTTPSFGFTKTAAYFVASQYPSVTAIHSIKIMFYSSIGGAANFSGNGYYCIQNVNCIVASSSCQTSPTPTGIAFTMN